MLGAQTAQEGEAEGGLLGQRLVAFQGVEVEQVGFDGVGVGAKGGAVTCVGDGFEDFLSDGEGGDVDAVGREKLGVGREVDGRDSVFCAVAAAGRGDAFDGEGPAEEGARVADVAGGDERGGRTG